MGLIQHWDTEINFWKMFPRLKLAFKYFYNHDKTKNKKRSSDVMWSIALCYDIDSEYYNYPDKFIICEKEIIGETGYIEKNQKVWNKLKEDYIKLTDTPAKKHKRTLDKKFEDRTKFLDTQEYSMDNAEQLDKMMVTTDKLYATLDKIKKMLEKENSERNIGNKELSLMDQNILFE